MARPTVKRTAVKNAPGIRRVVRTYETGRKVEKYEARVKVMGRDVSLGQFPTLNDARAAQTAAKSDVQRSSFVRPSAGKATFLSVAEDWLAGTRVVHAKPRTQQSYESIVRGRHLRPLHDVAVNRLDHKTLNRHIAALTAADLKPATVRHIANVMKYVLAEAVEQGLLSVNPMAKRSIALPRRATVQPYALSAAEVARLVAHLSTVSQRWATLVLFAAYTGARAGELQGLRASDLNFVRRTARIERTAQLIDGKWQVRPPKSAAGVRTAENLPRDLVSALETLTANMAPSDYVFGTPANAAKPGAEVRPTHPYSHANFMRRVFDPACHAVGLPTGRTKGGVGAHDLRHFFASMCIEAGMSPVEVARRLGHADPTLVLRTYAHMWERTDDRWADVFDNVLAGSARPSNVVPLRVAR